MDNITGLVITAIVATIGIIKFKLIEEFVKKITSDDLKSRGYTVILLATTIIVLMAVSLSLDPPPPADSALNPQPVANDSLPATPKSELEVQAETVKDGIEIADDLIQQAKENKRKKDSTFIANRSKRWVYQIGDWTNDDDKILQMHKQLLITENIKVVKQKKNYLFIKEDHLPKEDLEAELNRLKADLHGISVEVIDLNNLLTRKRDNFVERIETFGKRKRKIELECLVVN